MRAVLPVLALVALVFAGCLGPDETNVPQTTDVDPRLVPTFPNIQPDVVTALEPLTQLAEGLEGPISAAGIWVQGDYLYGSALGGGFYIADISDPANPVVLFDGNETTGTAFARDADVVNHPDGRITLVLATQTHGFTILDVTDPAAPELLIVLTDIKPNHNVAAIPGTTYVFNSPSGGEGQSNQIVDLTDPANPVVHKGFGTHGCHDITFFGKLGDDKFRAYCAGIQRTEIWDLGGLDLNATDYGIKLIGTVEVTGLNSPVVGNPVFAARPVRTLHHLAMPNEDGTILIIGDEHNGGGSPGTCWYNDGAKSTPFGALWFYDISDEAKPELLSWISPPTVDPEPPAGAPAEPTNPNAWTGTVFGTSPNCTAHFGTLIPGEEKLAMAWYSAGVLLIDFSDPEAPKILNQFQPTGVNTWDARVHNGYVFTGDMGRGLDVLKLV